MDGASESTKEQKWDRYLTYTIFPGMAERLVN
jgi:hypothetical protein